MNRLRAIAAYGSSHIYSSVMDANAAQTNKNDDSLGQAAQIASTDLAGVSSSATCSSYVPNPNNHIDIDKREEVDSLVKTSWKCTYDAYRVEPASGTRCKLGEVAVELGKRARYKECFTYDGSSTENYIPKLIIRNVSPALLEQNDEARKTLRTALDLVIERSRKLGFDGRVEWSIESLSEFRSAQEMGFFKSSNIREADEQIRDVLGALGTSAIYEKIDGLSFDMHFGVRMYLPVACSEVQSSSSDGYSRITDDEYRELFPSEECVLNQGDIGDCYLISSLKAIAENKKRKEIFQRLIEVNRDSYRVTFPKFPDTPVTVSKQGSSGLQECFAGSFVSGDIGYQLIEEAYAKLLIKREYCTENLPMLAKSMLRSSYPAHALQAITGIKPRCFNTRAEDSHQVYEETFQTASRGKSDIRDSLNDFLTELREDVDNYIITACTQVNSFPVEGDDRFIDQGSKRFRKGHAYSIVGIDEDRVYIVDPLFGDKVRELSYDEFAEYFSAIHAVKVND